MSHFHPDEDEDAIQNSYCHFHPDEDAKEIKAASPTVINNNDRQ